MPDLYDFSDLGLPSGSGSGFEGDYEDDENEFTVDWAKVIFSILICIVGLVGNTMTIFVIVILREYKKSVTHWYVLQLAVADTIFLLTLPFKANEDMVNEWQYPVWMCKAKESILFLNYYASILFLMIMSVDRYIAVCHTFSEFLQKFRRQFAASVITAATWLIALLLCTPFAMYSTKSGEQPNCKCEYRFTLAPKPVNYTARCHENEPGIQFLKFCLDYAKRQETEASFCRKPKGNIIQDYYNSNFSNYGSSYIGDSSGGNYSGDYDIASNDSAAYGILSNISGDDVDDYEFSGAGEHEEQKVCDYSGTTPTWKGIIYFNFFGMFLVPLFVMVASYGLIIHRLRTTRVKSNLRQSHKTKSQKSQKSFKSLKSLASTGGSTRKAPSRSDRDRRRVTIMCATLVLSFTLCWVLFHATHLAKMVGIRVPLNNDKYCYTLGAVGALLGYLNSALNPYLYSFLGTNFSRRWGEIRIKMRWLNRGRQQSWLKPKAGRKHNHHQQQSTNATATTNHHNQHQRISTAIKKNSNYNTIGGNKPQQTIITNLAKQPPSSRPQLDGPHSTPHVDTTPVHPTVKTDIPPKQQLLE